MNNDLKIIKKKYGEKMMHFCREFFPTLLEKEGLLSSLLLNNFNESHILYNDLVEQNLLSEFKEYIYSLVDVENLEEKEDNVASPEELLESVGYNLYECHTEEEVQSFRKYYTKEEELCTFTTGDRLNNYYVFFAVKKNVSEIKREDFKSPQRQDLYGTSVISIQFDKLVGNRLSIKNRYNHHVNNPDSTFSNNLDNIVPGLTKSFEKYYGIKQKKVNKGFEMASYIIANDGKYYKYNYEIDNVYYCTDNIIINDKVNKLPKEKFLVFDYFILDLETKKITSLTDDEFIDSIDKIEKIEILKCGLLKQVVLYQEEGSLITIVLDKENNIVGLDNPFVQEISDNFLYYNVKCRMINLSNSIKIGNRFMPKNKCIQEIIFENVKYIGDYFLANNLICKKIILPKTTIIGNNFMKRNKKCDYLYLPNAERIDDYFMFYNDKIRTVILAKLKFIPEYFFAHCHLETLIIPQALNSGEDISCFDEIKYLYAPKLYINHNEIYKRILQNISYCYTPLMPEYCNTTDFLKEQEIVDSRKLELLKR